MKCRYCDREAVYDDGMCESCHRLYQQYEQAEAKVMSDHERDSFRGQTIEEDGTVRDEQKAYEEQMREQQRRRSGVRIITSGLSWRVKLALALSYSASSPSSSAPLALSSWRCPICWVRWSFILYITSSRRFCIGKRRLT